MRRSFRELGPEQVLALAISLEEEDARLLQEFARHLRKNFPDTARALDALRAEEDTHRQRLIDMFRRRYGEEIPLVRRGDVRGFLRRDGPSMLRPLDPQQVGREVALMELETQRFYERAAERAPDAELRKLLGDLAEEERKHESAAESLDPSRQPADVREREALATRQVFILQFVQPGLAGLMDGSVSTLAPLFAAAYATHDPRDALLVGTAAAVGAGISMGFAEALSDDGALTGRGSPLVRGLVCGLMTFVGGIGHALPFLIPHFQTALVAATVVVALELVAIAWIRKRYMDTPFLSAMFQVVVGGVMVFLAGILIGSA